MRGIPATLATRADWLNAYEAARGTPGGQDLKARLCALQATRTILMLKKGAPTDLDLQTQTDFEPVADPASAFARSGLSDAEISTMIANL